MESRTIAPTLEEQPESATSTEARRPYEPPQIVESTRFETLALACLKQSSDILNCVIPGGPINNS